MPAYRGMAGEGVSANGHPADTPRAASANGRGVLPVALRPMDERSLSLTLGPLNQRGQRPSIAAGSFPRSPAVPPVIEDA